LTVCWPFGTLRRRIDRGNIRGRAKAGEYDQVGTGSAYLHAKIRTFTSATWRTSSTPFSTRSSPRWRAATGRAARLRRVLGEAAPGAHRPQSAHRRPCRRRSEMRAVLQDRQGNARTAESIEPRLTREPRSAGSVLRKIVGPSSSYRSPSSSLRLRWPIVRSCGVARPVQPRASRVVGDLAAVRSGHRADYRRGADRWCGIMAAARQFATNRTAL